MKKLQQLREKEKKRYEEMLSLNRRLKMADFYFKRYKSNLFLIVTEI